MVNHLTLSDGTAGEVNDSEVLARLVKLLIEKGIVTHFELTGEPPKNPKTLAEWDAWGKAKNREKTGK